MWYRWVLGDLYLVCNEHVGTPKYVNPLHGKDGLKKKRRDCGVKSRSLRTRWETSEDSDWLSSLEISRTYVFLSYVGRFLRIVLTVFFGRFPLIVLTGWDPTKLHKSFSFADNKFSFTRVECLRCISCSHPLFSYPQVRNPYLKLDWQRESDDVKEDTKEKREIVPSIRYETGREYRDQGKRGVETGAGKTWQR